MSTKETKEQLFARLRAQDPFLDDANLDTRGLPSFQNVELDDIEAKADPFDQNDYLHTTMNTKNALKAFLANPDNETIADAARLPNADPNLIADHNDRVAEAAGVAFREQVGSDYTQCQENYIALVNWLCQECLKFVPDRDVEDNVWLLQSKGWWSTENLLLAFRSLYDSGTLPVYPEGVARTLTAAQLTEINRLCQAGEVFPAVAMALRWAFDLDQYADLSAILKDPAKTPINNELVMFCWKAGAYDYDARNTGFDQFAAEFAGTRPFNIPLLNSAWAVFKEQQRSIARNVALGIKEPEPLGYEPQDFDKLTDSELERLRLDVMREKSRGKQ